MSCPPPKLNKLIRLYGPAYLHAGASIPQQPWHSPHSHDSFSLFRHASPHPPHPRKQFLDILYAILCNFMRVFSELWKLAVRDNDTKKWKKNIYGVGKTYCICKLRIKRNRASVSSDKCFFEKMIGRLCKPNICLSNFLFILSLALSHRRCFLTQIN